MHTRRNIGIMRLLVQFSYFLVLHGALCYGQYQPQYYHGQYLQTFPQIARRYAQVLYDTFAPTNNHEKRQAPSVPIHNVMPATANMIEQDPVAASQSMSFVVRDPGLQHQDIVNFLTSDKRISQQPTPAPKSNTYMYEFWQNTQLPVVHWMPLDGNKPTAGTPQPPVSKINSGKPLPPKAKADNRQSIRNVSPVVHPTIPTATFPVTLPVNQPPLARRLQPSKNRKVCRPGFCPGASNQQALTPPSPALPAIASVPQFQLPEQAQKHTIAKATPQTAAPPAHEAVVTHHDSQKPTDLLSQHPFKSNKNVSHSVTRVRPLSRRPEMAKPAVTSSGRLKSIRPPTRAEEPITQKPTPLVHTELPAVVNDEVPHVEDGVATHYVDDATVHKYALSSLFPRRDLHRPSFLASKKNVTMSTHDEAVPKVTVIPSRVPTRTTTISPKRVSIFRSIRPNSTYPARQEAPALSPQIGKIKAEEKTSDVHVEEHQVLSKPLNVARSNANGRRNQASAAVKVAPKEEAGVTPTPVKRKLFNTAGRTQGIRRKLVKTNSENNSTQPSEQSNPVPEAVSIVTESTTTATELPTSTTTTTPSTSTSPKSTTTIMETMTASHPSTIVPPTVPTRTRNTESPSTTTEPSTLPTTNIPATTTPKTLEPVIIKTSVSQVVHVSRSESRRAQRVKQPRAQAQRLSGDTVKRHTDVQDRLPKAIDLFELFDSTTITSTEQAPPSTKMSVVEHEVNSLDETDPQLVIVQAPKRRPSLQKDQETSEITNELGTTPVRSTAGSTTTATSKPSSSSTPPASTSTTTTTPSTETPTSHHTNNTAAPTFSSATPFVKSTGVLKTTSIPTSTTEKTDSSTVTTSTVKVTTLIVTDPSHPPTIKAKLAQEKAKVPFPFGTVTTEPSKEHKLPIISKKSAVASNQHSTTNSTTLSTEKTKATVTSTPPITTDATTPLSPKAGFLEMIRNAAFRKVEDKPVGRSGSYSNISIFRPTLLG